MSSQAYFIGWEKKCVTFLEISRLGTILPLQNSAQSSMIIAVSDVYFWAKWFFTCSGCIWFLSSFLSKSHCMPQIVCSHVFWEHRQHSEMEKCDLLWFSEVLLLHFGGASVLYPSEPAVCWKGTSYFFSCSTVSVPVVFCRKKTFLYFTLAAWCDKSANWSLLPKLDGLVWSLMLLLHPTPWHILCSDNTQHFLVLGSFSSYTRFRKSLEIEKCFPD